MFHSAICILKEIAGTYHVKIMTDDAMTADRTPVARCSQRTDDAGAHQDRQVESVLRVPLRRCGVRGISVSFVNDPSLLTPSSAGSPQVGPPHRSEANPLSDQRMGRLQGKCRPSEHNRSCTKKQTRVAGVEPEVSYPAPRLQGKTGRTTSFPRILRTRSPSEAHPGKREAPRRRWSECSRPGLGW